MVEALEELGLPKWKANLKLKEAETRERKMFTYAQLQGKTSFLYCKNKGSRFSIFEMKI